MTVKPNVTNQQAKLAEPHSALGLEDSANLLPGGIHIPFLVVLNYARAETGGDAKAWIEIETVDPVLGGQDRVSISVGQHAFHQRMPGAVERCGNNWVRMSGNVKVVSQIYQVCQILL